MTNHALVNLDDHKDTRIIDTRSELYGDNVMFTMTFPFEFRNIQQCYPIFFHKNSETGALYPVALFGFKDKENLFLNSDGWSAPYVPLMIKRQPFFIGFQKDQDDPDKRSAKVAIDMDSPRISADEGEALFEEHGGNSEFLIRATQNLEMINAGNQHSEKFVAALIEHDLIESFSLDIELSDGSDNQLLGFYTINEDKLQELDGATMESFNKQGFLQPIFMLLASHSCMSTLLGYKNATLV